MRRIERFGELKEDKKTYGIDYGGTLKDTVVRTLSYEDEEVVFPEGVTPVKFYSVNGGIYFYGDDGKIYEKTADTFDECFTATFESTPELISVLHGGSYCLLAFCEESAVLKSLTEEDISMPYGSVYTVYNGMLFLAVGGSLRFSERYDFTDFTVGLDLGGYINGESEYGDIVGLKEIGGKLYIFYRHKICVLTADGDREDYTLKTVDTPYLDIDGDTFNALNRIAVFFSGKKFIAFDGEIKYIDNPDIGDFTVRGKAFSYKDMYILLVSYMQNNGLILYDAIYRKTSYKQDGVPLYLYANGVGYDGQDKISFPKVTENFINGVENIAVKEDMGVCELKALKEICVDISGSCNLKVKGEFGERRYNIESGCNQIKCNLVSRSFDISATDRSVDFKIYKFTVKYKIYR